MSRVPKPRAQLGAAAPLAARLPRTGSHTAVGRPKPPDSRKRSARHATNRYTGTTMPQMNGVQMTVRITRMTVETQERVTHSFMETQPFS